MQDPRKPNHRLRLMIILLVKLEMEETKTLENHQEVKMMIKDMALQNPEKFKEVLHKKQEHSLCRMMLINKKENRKNKNSYPEMIVHLIEAN